MGEERGIDERRDGPRTVQGESRREHGNISFVSVASVGCDWEADRWISCPRRRPPLIVCRGGTLRPDERFTPANWFPIRRRDSRAGDVAPSRSGLLPISTSNCPKRGRKLARLVC